MGDDVQMAEGAGTHEILPVYQPNTKSAFNAYKVRSWRGQGLGLDRTRITGGFRSFASPCLAIVDAAWKAASLLIGGPAQWPKAAISIRRPASSVAGSFFIVIGGGRSFRHISCLVISLASSEWHFAFGLFGSFFCNFAIMGFDWVLHLIGDKTLICY